MLKKSFCLRARLQPCRKSLAWSAASAAEVRFCSVRHFFQHPLQPLRYAIERPTPHSKHACFGRLSHERSGEENEETKNGDNCFVGDSYCFHDQPLSCSRLMHCALMPAWRLQQ